MTYKIFITDDRIRHLINELGDRVKILDKKEKDMTTTPVEITINEGIDLLNVFHAGVRVGINMDA
jgi:hypothetical protein